mmetsp:Transcript_15800/g.26481  ORF Transcript_15800/g.26481 Transcript_15800/m.26481 type:complete len:200 (-) Transcript_15800:1640-2239(-)
MHIDRLFLLDLFPQLSKDRFLHQYIARRGLTANPNRPFGGQFFGNHATPDCGNAIHAVIILTNDESDHGVLDNVICLGGSLQLFKCQLQEIIGCLQWYFFALGVHQLQLSTNEIQLVINAFATFVVVLFAFNSTTIRKIMYFCCQLGHTQMPFRIVDILSCRINVVERITCHIVLAVTKGVDPLVIVQAVLDESTKGIR